MDGKASLKGAWLSHVNHLNFGGHNHIPGKADRLRRSQLSSPMSVINFWRPAAMLITSTDEICIQQLGQVEEMVSTARRSYASRGPSTIAELLVIETTLWVKIKQATIILPIISPNQKLTDFHSSFTDRFTSKCATKWSLTISPHLKYVTTLPCETSITKKAKIGSIHRYKRQSTRLCSYTFEVWWVIQ